MPYMYNGKALRTGKGFTDTDGVQHPANWASAWSKDEIAEKGITWVDPEPTFDNRFYWSAGVPRTLEDVAEVDENGDPVLDEKGVQVITKGLKTQAIEKIKAQAGGMLAKTDWMIIREAEGIKTAKQETKAYRKAIRDASDAIEASIVACATLEDFMALHETPVDAEGNPTGNAPIADWPEE